MTPSQRRFTKKSSELVMATLSMSAATVITLNVLTPPIANSIETSPDFTLTALDAGRCTGLVDTYDDLVQSIGQGPIPRMWPTR